MHFRSILTLAIAFTFGAAAHADDYKAGDLRIQHPYARATVAHQPSGAAYLAIENKGKNADKLIAVSSPVAKSAEIHSMSMDGNVMKMREVDGIEIKPSARVAMEPGHHGYHIMLVGLKQPLKAGDKFPLTLTFEKSGKVDVSVSVEEKNAKSGKADADAAAHQHH